MKSIVFSIDITLLDVHLSCLHFSILVVVSLIILLGYMIFLSQFLDLIRMSMPTVSLLAQLDSGILRLQHAFF